MKAKPGQRTTNKKWDKVKSTAVTQAAQTLDSSQFEGEGQIETVQLNSVRVDFSQPRTSLKKMGLTPDEIIKHREGEIDLSKSEDPIKRKAFEYISNLGQSIKSIKLIQAPTFLFDRVDPEKPYTVESGGRRFLALLLIGRTAVRGIVRADNTESSITASRQLIENIHRDDLTLIELHSGLVKLNNAHIDEEQKELAVSDIKKTLSVKESQAYRFHALLNAESDVIKAIEEGKVTNIKLVYKLKGVTEKIDRQKLIEDETSLIISADEKPVQEKGISIAKPQKARGRTATSVNLGKIDDTKVVETIIQKTLGKSVFNKHFKDTDWTQFKDSKDAWKSFLELLQEQMK